VHRAAVLDSSDSGARSESEPRDQSLRRFAFAVTVGWLVVTVPYLWFLTDLWNRSPSLLRTVLPNGRLGNFYDLQARAMFHGHLYVPSGSLGLEAFVHDGRQYTYYGLFPSLLRMPILLFTHRLDGRLSTLSILLAWLVTGVFSTLLLWRVRGLIRGRALLGRAEAVTYGFLFAAIMGGSILVYLAANPWVYTEDVAWGTALTIGSLFALVGVLEAPTRQRVMATGLLILAVELTRGSLGLGCVMGAALAAVWFASGHSGSENRRWWLPVFLAGALPLCVAFAVSWAKFGVLSGYPLHDQLYFERYLSTIKGSYFSLTYVPTTVATYLGLPGLHFSSVFPFITLPSYPARAVGHVSLFGSEEVASVPGSMPLLFLLALWGLIVAFRPHAHRQPRMVAIPLIAAGIPVAIILVFGFLTQRFVGDFLPLLVLGSAAGMAALWNRLQRCNRRLRVVVLGVVAGLSLFSVAANTALASTPTGWWSGYSQAYRFVHFQKAIGDFIGVPLAENVVRGQRRPVSAPLDQLFIAGDCAGFYISPSYGLRSWLPVEASPGRRNSLCQSLLK